MRFYSTICLSFSVLVSSQLSAQNIAPLAIEDKALFACVTQQANELALEDILKLTKLKCHGMSIKSLNGLEALTQLTSLSLYNNQLTNADLRAFKKLEALNIANNKLNEIKLNNLASLQTLYLFKNKLSTVDFTGLGQLKKVRITNNKLTSLDISPLTSLEKAYFFDNKLEDLVVTGLPELAFIELRQNPMSDEVYDRYDAIDGMTIIHDGNADDWK